MKTKLILSISILVAFAIIVFQNPFQKGGVNHIYFYIYPIHFLTLTIIQNSIFNFKIQIWKQLVLSIVIFIFSFTASLLLLSELIEINANSELYLDQYNYRIQYNAFMIFAFLGLNYSSFKIVKLLYEN